MEQTQHLDNEEIPKLHLNDAPEYVPAGLGIRLGASMLDGIILYMMTLPFQIGLQIVVAYEQAVLTVIAYIVTNLIYFYITGWFISRKGGLPGKMLLGLKIIDTRTGYYPSIGRAVSRELFGKMLSSLTLGIGFLMAAFRKDKKALHDLLIKTQVMKKVKK